MAGFILDSVIKKILEESANTFSVEKDGKQYRFISTEVLIELEQAYNGQNTKATKIEEIKCPECGGEMISRKGQYGIFWGCKNYPRCKGTRDSMGRSKQDRESEKNEKEDKRSKREWTVE